MLDTPGRTGLANRLTLIAAFGILAFFATAAYRSQLRAESLREGNKQIQTAIDKLGVSSLVSQDNRLRQQLSESGILLKLLREAHARSMAGMRLTSAISPNVRLTSLYLKGDSGRLRGVTVDASQCQLFASQIHEVGVSLEEQATGQIDGVALCDWRLALPKR